LEIENYTRLITEELLSVSINTEKLPDLSCPKCSCKRMVVREKYVRCRIEGCNWIFFRNVCGVHIALKDVAELIDKRKTGLIKGMTSKAGKKFDARIVLNEEAETAFEFDKNRFRKK
jgi:DNA topoisomerase-3